MTNRAYCVGLPVIVTVHDDGVVEVEVDMSEASSGITEEWGENPEMQAGWSEDRALLDSAILDAHPNTGNSVRHEAAVAEMRCPVGYSCKFRSFDLSEMAEHIANTDLKHGRI